MNEVLRPAGAALMFLTACLSAVLCSCRRDVEVDSPEKGAFLMEDAMGLYQDGEPEFVYAEMMHQMSRNDSRGMFRIQTDVQDTCLAVVCRIGTRKIGSSVTVWIDYENPRERISSEYEFECSRITGSGIWLWNSEYKLGIIVPGG